MTGHGVPDPVTEVPELEHELVALDGVKIVLVEHVIRPNLQTATPTSVQVKPW